MLRLFQCAVAAAAVLASVLPVAGGESPDVSRETGRLVISADAQWDFAQRSFQDEAYQRAIDAYLRFIHFFPADARVPSARLQVALAHMRSGRFDQALPYLYPLAETPQNRFWEKANFLISECYLQLHSPDQAAERLEYVIAQTREASVRDNAQYRLAWVYLEAGAWQEARAALGAISAAGRITYRVPEMEKRLGHGSPFATKNPRTAGVLALMPGAGHLYTGRYQDAAVAFLLTGALFLAAAESFGNDLPILGGLLGGVGVGFYVGNIYSAVNSAHKYNRAAAGDFIESLKSGLYLNIHGGLQDGGVGLTVGFRF